MQPHPIGKVAETGLGSSEHPGRSGGGGSLVPEEQKATLLGLPWGYLSWALHAEECGY